jgi:hypothetical protein
MTQPWVAFALSREWLLSEHHHTSIHNRYMPTRQRVNAAEVHEDMRLCFLFFFLHRSLNMKSQPLPHRGTNVAHMLPQILLRYINLH